MPPTHDLPSLPPLPPLKVPQDSNGATLHPGHADGAPLLQSPAPSFADSFSTAFTSPSEQDNEDKLDSPSRLGSATLVPPQSLRKSISVDSFVHYGRESAQATGPRPNRGNTSSAVDPPRRVIFGISSALKKEREEPSQIGRDRGASVGSVRDEHANYSLADSDTERYERLGSPVDRYRRASLKGHEPARVIRGGELPLPSRAPALSTTSSMSSIMTASTNASTTTNTTEEASPQVQLATSSLPLIPQRRATPVFSANAGRTRSGSLGVYAPSSGRRMLINTHISSYESPSAAVTLAVVGTAGSGKSAVIRSGLAGYRLSEPTSFFASRSATLVPPCFTRRSTRFNEGDTNFPLHVIEVDIPATSTDISLQHTLVLPADQPPIDGVLICYDSSTLSSFQPVESLLKTYGTLKLPIVVLACKVDQERQIEPEKALQVLKGYDVGLVEVTNAHDGGKNKMRQSFDFILKAILRERRAIKLGSTGGYKNPASPDILTYPPPWEHSRTSTPTASSSVLSMHSISPHASTYAPQSPVLSIPIPHTPTSPTRARSMGDLLYQNEKSKASPMPSAKREADHRASSAESLDKATKALDERSNGVRSLPEGKREGKEKEPRPAQWATLDELLDKLLFLAVSGDDPTFVAHFLLTYRRFATPRHVLLAMQKRMRQLDNPCGDPMFACFAQMRICHLLQTWMEKYPHDFAVKGTAGALHALIKSIISKTHLLHYGSEFLPFLEMLPGLQDTDHIWALKADLPADESDDSPIEDEDEDDLPLDKEYTTQKASSDSQKVEPGAIHAVLPLRERKASLPLPKSLIASAPPNGIPLEDTDPSPKQLIRDLVKLSQEVNLLDPEEIAQEITRMELRLFLDIKPRNWLHYTFVSGKKDEMEPITAFNAVSNHLADWVISLILCHDRPKTRARQIEKLVEIAQRLRALNNYSALRAFVAGINNATFAGDETMEYFKTKSPEHAKNLQSWDVLLQQIRAHRAYRLALRNTKGACIPALEVHMSDLIRAHEGNEDSNSSDPSKIHWGKYNMMGRFISSTTQCQTQCTITNDYTFPDRMAIRELIVRPVMNAEMQKSRIAHDDTDDYDHRPAIPAPNQPRDVAVLRKLFFW
ncbi:ras guanine nucleotide exchange factor domain-containing protein [Crucibulum laeve]|uniref:Ras guanine nucleotide exchange factor domain-containing protein n=1 Tax=Crucibulum laeve TaxID=68775 RepID=A0A5C3M9K6_9AGAR|nr:ras guanine nucleotide exchange factor domain-containing protein [Crucibulum laeve]